MGQTEEPNLIELDQKPGLIHYASRADLCMHEMGTCQKQYLVVSSQKQRSQKRFLLLLSYVTSVISLC